MHIKKKCVVLLSGGLDSSANLAFCREQDEPILALTADYGQRAAKQEIAAAKKLCDHFDIRHEVLNIQWLGALGGSSLTESSRAVPQISRDKLDELATIQDTARSVWVPNRNGVLINAGAAYAERLEANWVVVGFNREEAVTFPDNSAAFLESATQALQYSTQERVGVFCYTTDLNKVEIVQRLNLLGPPFPFEKLWSCYHGGERPCGVCESCQRLSRAYASGTS